MEWNWSRTERSLSGGSSSGSGRWHRLERRGMAAYRVGGGGSRLSRRSVAVADLNPGGCDHVKEEWTNMNIDSDSTCSSSSQLEESSFASRGLTEVLMPEQTPKDVARHSSPGVIAKLMGLDELPPPDIACKRQMTRGRFSQKPHFTGFQEKHVAASDHSFRMSTSERQGKKYFVEGIELEVEKDHNMAVSKAMSSFGGRQSALICNSKIVDEKDFSIDESLKSSTEANEELADQDTEKDHFVKAYKGSDSQFKKKFHDLRWLVPSHQARLTTMNSSKHERTELLYRSQRKSGRFPQLKNEVKNSISKSTANLVTCTPKEHQASPSHDMAKLKRSGNNHLYVHPRPFAVLKPSLESHLTGASALLPQNTRNVQFGKKRQIMESRFPEIYAKRNNSWNSFNNIHVVGGKTKGSREIAREVTDYMKQYIGTDAKEVPYAGHNRYRKKENSCLYGMDNLRNSSSLLTSSIESIRGRETRSNLSKRSKLTNRAREAESSGTHLRTLGEMFALSDRETSRIAFSSTTLNKISDSKSGKGEMPTGRDSSLSVTNRDGWIDWYLIKLPKPPYDSYLSLSDGHKYRSSGQLSRRESFPKRSSTGISNMLQPFNYDENGYELHPGKMPVEAEESSKKYHVKAPESNSRFCSDGARSDAIKLVRELSDSNSMDMDRCHLTNKKLSKQTTNNKYAMKNVEISCSQKVGCHPGHLEVTELEPESPSSSKETVQPSPFSVLELPRKRGVLHLPDQVEATEMEPQTSSNTKDAVQSSTLSTLEFPQKKSTEFHVQPQFDGSGTLHDDVSRGGCQFIEQKGQMIEEFMDEEERDFAYLLDVLIHSGIHNADQSRLYKTGCLQEYPLGTCILEKLGKKYRKLILWSASERNLVLWSRSERKLLFDFINFILAEILAPCIDPYPWANCNRKVGPMWGSEGLVEKTWQLWIRKREELSTGNAEEKVLDGKWLELVHYVDEIGREIEEMLHMELLKELVSEFILD